MSSIEERMIKMLNQIAASQRASLEAMVEELKRDPPRESGPVSPSVNGDRATLAAHGVHMTDDTAALLSNEDLLEKARDHVNLFHEEVKRNMEQYQEKVLAAVGQMRPEEVVDLVVLNEMSPDDLIEIGGVADCVWCGVALEKSDPISVRAHTMVCEEHPMRALEREILGLQAQVRSLGHELNVVTTRTEQFFAVMGQAKILFKEIQDLLEPES